MEKKRPEEKKMTTNRLLQAIYIYYEVENKDGLNKMLQESVINFMTEDVKFLRKREIYAMNCFASSLMHIRLIETAHSTYILPETLLDIILEYAIQENAFEEERSLSS